jgi:hypothetical protein
MKQLYQAQWTEEAFMKSIGYHLIKDDGEYAQYGNDHGIVCPSYGILPRDKRQVFFNRGYDAKQGVFVGIREDWDTRNVYNGICTTEEFLKLLINSVR